MQFVENPLNETELDEVAALLEALPSADKMNLEMLDGYFAALLAGPEHPPASEYLAVVYGLQPGDETPPFADAAQSRRLAELLQRHWETMGAQLFGLLEKDEVYVPVMAEDEQGNALGNDWAVGFLKGTERRYEFWEELYEDDDEGLLTPMLLLANEHHADPDLRSPPIGAGRRASLLDDMAWNLTLINRYYADHRLTGGKPREPFRREGAKVGRNDPCPCGSGKKFKQCCGKLG